MECFHDALHEARLGLEKCFKMFQTVFNRMCRTYSEEIKRAQSQVMPAVALGAVVEVHAFASDAAELLFHQPH